MSINEKQAQIIQLENEVNQIKEANFKKASKNWFTLLNIGYESASYRTEEYLTFCRVFKRQFKKLLNDTFDISKIDISKPNHFDQTGFFELKNGNIYYFSIEDLRWKPTFLLRTAKSFKDYSGGSNDYCHTEDFESFMNDLKRIVDNSEIDNSLYGFPHEKCGTGLYLATKKDAKNSKCTVCKKPFLEAEKK